MNFCTLLLEHYARYPKLEMEDVFKFMHQGAMGPGHLISSAKDAEEGILRETENATDSAPYPIENLGAFSRVPLLSLKPETLGKLLFLSANGEAAGKESLLENIGTVRALIKEKKLPFSLEAFDKKAEKWEADGFCPVHHSETFRTLYAPFYRVICSRFVPFLPLFREMDERLNKGRSTLAIEGGSGSGKTTLAALLQNVYGATVFHMDDFFLRPRQRTAERYKELGGNIDRERFLEEVLLPLKEGEPVSYRKFDCHTLSLSDPVTVIPEKLTIIEGAYSMHPLFSDFYNFSVFLDISEALQKDRIEKRNGDYAPVFFEKWIPMEKAYFAGTDIKNRCDYIIKI